MTKEELRLKEKELKEKVKQFPKSKIWKLELKRIKEKLYGTHY